MTNRAFRMGLLTGAGLSACLFAAGQAPCAEPGPDTLAISVIAVQTPDADDQAEALTKALRAAVKGLPGWSLAEGDYSLEVLTISLKCVEPPDVACQSRIADQIKADRYVWGIIQKDGPSSVKGDIHLWIRGQGTNDAKVSYSANLTEANDDALRRVAQETMDKLTGGPPKGTVHVKVGKDIAGQVFIDGQPVGALSAGEGKFSYPAGAHKVSVKAEGYSSVETPVSVKPQATSEVAVTLVPLESAQPTNWKRIGGFVGIGAGVVFGAVGAISGVSVLSKQNDFDEYRKQTVSPNGNNGYAQQTDICQFARDNKTFGANGTDPQVPADRDRIISICDETSTLEVLQYIMYPLAAISAGAGVYLLMTSSSAAEAAPKAGWTIKPSVGLRSGSLDFTYRF